MRLNDHNEEEISALYILCYMAFVVCFIIMLVCRDTLFSVWHIRGSTKMHNDLFTKVLEVGTAA